MSKRALIEGATLLAAVAFSAVAFTAAVLPEHTVVTTKEKIGSFDPIPVATVANAYLYQATLGGARSWVQVSIPEGGITRIPPSDSFTTIEWALDEDAGQPFNNSGTAGNPTNIPITVSYIGCQSDKPGIFKAAIRCEGSGASNGGSEQGVGTGAPVPIAGEPGLGLGANDAGLTWSTWLYPISFNGANASYFAKDYASNSWNQPFITMQISEGSGSGDGTWCCAIGTNVDGGAGAISQTCQNSNDKENYLQKFTWQWLTCTWDNTQNRLQQYLNGRYVSGVGVVGVNLSYGDGGYEIAVVHQTSSPVTTGLFDDIRIEGINRCLGYNTGECPPLRNLYLTSAYGSIQ